MKALFFISSIAAFVLTHIPSLSGQNPTFTWAKGLYSSQTTFNTLGPNSVELDDQGNVYVLGVFQGTVDLDPGSSETILTSNGEGFGYAESFLAKYDRNGDFIFGFKLDVNASNMAITSDGDIYLIGDFDTLVDFNPGEGIHTLDGTRYNTFIARYNKDGAYQSALGIGQGGRSDVRSVGLDSKNNLYLYGTYRDTVDIAPSGNTKLLRTSSTNGALYLAKFSDNSALQFAFSINSQTTNWEPGLAFDSEDNVFISGPYFARGGSPPLDLDPGPNNTNFRGIAGVDGFWAKYSPDGDYLAGFLYDGNMRQLRIDNSNNLYLSGSTTDGMDVDLSAGEYKLYTAPGGFDQFLVKYNASFELIYGFTFRGNSMEMRTEDMRIDDNQNVYLCGDFRDTIGFVKGSAHGDIVAKGARDAFMAKFDKAGQLKYAHSFGSENTDAAKHLNLDNKGNIWLTGTFTDAITMETDNTQNTLVNTTGGGALFLSKFFDPLTLNLTPLENQLNKVMVYPSNGHVVVEFTNQNPIEATIKIIGINGQVYHTLANVNSTSVYISFSELPKNQAFIVRVENQGQYLSKKMYMP